MSYPGQGPWNPPRLPDYFLRGFAIGLRMCSKTAANYYSKMMESIQWQYRRFTGAKSRSDKPSVFGRGGGLL